MHTRPHIRRLQVDSQVHFLWHLVRIVDARKPFDLAPPRLCVDAPPIRPFAVLQRRRHVHEEETAMLVDHRPRQPPAGLEWGNGRGDDGRAGLGELRCDEADALDVDAAVLAGEAELRGELAADGFAEEEGDGAAALLVEGHVEGAGDGVFAAVLVAGEHDGEALFVAGRVGLAQDADDFGVGEPFGDVAAGAEAVAEFWKESQILGMWIHEHSRRCTCSANIKRADAGLYLILGLVLV